jgi:hypothetical protein
VLLQIDGCKETNSSLSKMPFKTETSDKIRTSEEDTNVLGAWR